MASCFSRGWFFKKAVAQIVFHLRERVAHSGCRNLTTSSNVGITVRRRGPVLCLGINRQEMKNCLTPQIASQLLKEIESFEKDDQSLVAVLYGERGTFSYGIHPEDFKENPMIHEEILKTGLFNKFPVKPVVAAVTGYAIGLAFDLALWCDFRVAEETSIVASYARNGGVPAGEQLVRRLEACVGSHRALDWLLTGRAVKAKEALECGAVSRIVACGTGVGQAVNFAHSIANMPQAAMRADRALVYSRSQKFEDVDLIKEELEKNRVMALQEAKSGQHVTSTGDVRHKDWT